MEKENTLGKRFLNAYNILDHCLRTQYNFKTNISFSDLIRRAATLNQVIRAYEDDLIDLARLRNAIVHHRSDQIIAEPHKEIVEFMEKVARIISTPPLAVDVIKSLEVRTVQSSMTLKQFILETVRVGHGNLPVIKNGAIIGVVRREAFIQNLGLAIESGKNTDDFIGKTTVEQYLHEFPSSVHFRIASVKITIEEVIKSFDLNRKLAIIILTSDGSAGGTIRGIITSTDLIELMQVIKDFKKYV